MNSASLIVTGYANNLFPILWVVVVSAFRGIGPFVVRFMCT